MDASELRSAAPIRIERDFVETHILPTDARPLGDDLFAAALRDGLETLPLRQRRGALSVSTGHIAESVVESLLVEVGYTPIWHFEGPGRHGVDLLMVTPAFDGVLAIEVKGTLSARRRWPRFRSTELNQMTPAWLEKADNPGMREFGFRAEDLYGAIVLVSFSALAVKSAVTADFLRLRAVTDWESLVDLAWVEEL